MEFSVIGKSAPRVDARAKVMGKAKYTEDFKELGMLHAKVLRKVKATEAIASDS